jgi:hypothetical protein
MTKNITWTGDQGRMPFAGLRRETVGIISAFDPFRSTLLSGKLREEIDRRNSFIKNDHVDWHGICQSIYLAPANISRLYSRDLYQNIFHLIFTFVRFLFVVVNLLNLRYVVHESWRFFCHVYGKLGFLAGRIPSDLYLQRSGNMNITIIITFYYQMVNMIRYLNMHISLWFNDLLNGQIAAQVPLPSLRDDDIYITLEFIRGQETTTLVWYDKNNERWSISKVL